MSSIHLVSASLAKRAGNNNSSMMAMVFAHLEPLRSRAWEEQIFVPDERRRP